MAKSKKKVQPKQKANAMPKPEVLTTCDSILQSQIRKRAARAAKNKLKKQKQRAALQAKKVSNVEDKLLESVASDTPRPSLPIDASPTKVDRLLDSETENTTKSANLLALFKPNECNVSVASQTKSDNQPKTTEAVHTTKSLPNVASLTDTINPQPTERTCFLTDANAVKDETINLLEPELTAATMLMKIFESCMNSEIIEIPTKSVPEAQPSESTAESAKRVELDVISSECNAIVHSPMEPVQTAVLLHKTMSVLNDNAQFDSKLDDKLNSTTEPIELNDVSNDVNPLPDKGMEPVKLHVIDVPTDLELQSSTILLLNAACPTLTGNESIPKTSNTLNNTPEPTQATCLSNDVSLLEPENSLESFMTFNFDISAVQKSEQIQAAAMPPVISSTRQILKEPQTVAGPSTIDEVLQFQGYAFEGLAPNDILPIENGALQELDMQLEKFFSNLKNLRAYLREYEHKLSVCTVVQPSVGLLGIAPYVVPMKRKSAFSNLPQYAVSKVINRLAANDFKHKSNMRIDERIAIKKMDQLKETGLTVDNYADMLSMLIEIEDHACQNETNRLNKKHAKISHVGADLYKFKMAFYEKPAASIMVNDHIWVVSRAHRDKAKGVVVEITDNSVIFRANHRLKYCAETRYRIHFVWNRLTVRLEHKAVERVKGFNLAPFLFPTAPQWTYSAQDKRLYLVDNRINDNAEQLKAVRNIVYGVASHSIPYLLIGLPGTGKTQVLVESIFQLWMHQKQTRILVCSTSNYVVDEITLRLVNCFRLLGNIQPDIVRVFATSRLNTEIPSEFRNISNVYNTESSRILLKLLLNHRIVLSTLSAAGRIALLNMRSDFFTHVFIDECESSCETMQLIPIAGICSSMGKIHPRIILAGDTQQLGPLLRSKEAKILNYGMSMLERLLRNPIYDPLSENSHTTMLVKNYRSHHMIVKPANDLFYQGKMEVFDYRFECQLAVGLSWLPQPNFPLFVEHVQGFAKQQVGGYSWHNSAERIRVIHYVEMLLLQSSGRFHQKDIGIIAPYKTQCALISDECHSRGWPNIKVGSAEQFQGQERTIIIISTVRTSRTQLGFLDEPKRINVMLTRAKALMIVIGDIANLIKNSNWRHLLNYCRNHNAVVEYPLP